MRVRKKGHYLLNTLLSNFRQCNPMQPLTLRTHSAWQRINGCRFKSTNFLKIENVGMRLNLKSWCKNRVAHLQPYRLSSVNSDWEEHSSSDKWEEPLRTNFVRMLLLKFTEAKLWLSHRVSSCSWSQRHWNCCTEWQPDTSIRVIDCKQKWIAQSGDNKDY